MITTTWSRAKGEFLISKFLSDNLKLAKNSAFFNGAGRAIPNLVKVEKAPESTEVKLVCKNCLICNSI